MLNNSYKKFGSKTAFLRKTPGTVGYIPITYSQYKNDVDAFGTALCSLGLKGKPIAIIGENRYEWSVSYLSVINGTGVVVPLDRELPVNEIILSLNRAEVSAIIFSPKLIEKVSQIKDSVPTLEKFIIMDYENLERTDNILDFWTLLELGHKLLNEGNRDFIDSEIDPEAMSVLLFTSGTTENSKAVMLSHRNICRNLMAMTQMVYIGEKDVFLSLLPIHHTYECTCGFLCPIYRGCTVAYCEGLRHITQNMEEAKVTMVLVVPLILESMYKKVWDTIEKSGMTKKVNFALKISKFLLKFGIDLRKKLFAKIHESFGGHIRLFISGAANIDSEILAGFRNFGILAIQGYGLTECAPIAALNRNCDYKDSAAGLPLPGLEIKLDDENNEGIGEIIVKGPNVMLGYYNNPEATKNYIKDGWFFTGDLGYIDSDNFVHITGRKKNVIVTKNGKNIYPEEIEFLLLKSPYIEEVVVYGDNSGDDTVVKAIVFPSFDNIKADIDSGKLLTDNIHDIIRAEIKATNKQITNYKDVKDFTIRDTEFEKTTTKKIKRYVLNN
ncbi:MAG: AMP-binding protein [Clostridiales bacterium]|nr:AMP-binding protein [Clostridiales bacterium]